MKIENKIVRKTRWRIEMQKNLYQKVVRVTYNVMEFDNHMISYMTHHVIDLT